MWYNSSGGGDNMTSKEEFKSIAELIHRDGIADLMRWIESTDFYTAPASTRFHGAYEGGLVEHCVAVYHRLDEMNDFFGEVNATPETIAIVALFHDLCKIGTYKTEMRWRKDANNQWEQYPTYKRDEDFKFGGHGSKSLYLVQNFIKLTPEEAIAINCHMGQWDATTYSDVSSAFESCPLAWALHVADEAASYLDKT